MTISIEKIKKVQGQNLWSFGNQTLYEMCEKAPLHINKEEIVGKIWLIGRSYAAAIERGALSNYKGDSFYRYDVAEKVKVVGAELDRRIATLKGEPKVTKELLKEVIETHNFLTGAFCTITGKENRSLASKYLHFHVPNVFYIYDSIACREVTKLRTLDRELKQYLLKYNCDYEYVDFVAKIFPLNMEIYQEHGVWLTPRQLDSLLLEY
jgi:hypothetical protein